MTSETERQVAFIVLCAVVGLAGGAAAVWGKRRFAEMWPMRTRKQRWAILAAAVAAFALLLFTTEPEKGDAAVIFCLGVGLLSLYLLFSRAMDALWKKMKGR
jgi:dolichol kinase